VSQVNVLPPELARRFTVVETIQGRDGQAEVHVVRAAGTGEARILKIYWESPEKLADRSYSDLLEVWHAYSRRGPSEVVHLEEYGQIGPTTIRGVENYRIYEVQEYIERGTLRPLLDSATESDVARRVALANHLAAELAKLLRFAHHEMSIWHSDLKPENLFVREMRSNGQPTLALGDFGSARERLATVEIASRKHITPQYAAPEILQDETLLTEERDYWSAGIIIYEALHGRRPYHGRGMDLAMGLMTAPVDLSEVTDERLRLLLSGLLHREAAKRWGADELTTWLSGDTPTVLPDQFGFSTAGSSAVGFNVQGEIAWSMSDLVELLNLAWREADAEYLQATGTHFADLQNWMAEQFGPEARDAVDITLAVAPDGVEESVWSDTKLARLGAAYRPSDPVFRPELRGDGRLTLNNLEAVASEAAGTEDQSAAAQGWLSALFDSNALTHWSAAQGVEPGLARIAHRWRVVIDELIATDLDPAEFHAQALLAHLNEDYRDGLASSAATAARDEVAMQQPWFAELAARTGSEDELIARDLGMTIRVSDAHAETVRENAESARNHQGFGGAVRRMFTWASGRAAGARPPLIEQWHCSFARAPLGTAMTIEWRIRNAESVTISGIGPVESEGNRRLAPNASGTIVLRAVALGGLIRERRHQFIVDQLPVFLECEVSPRAVVAGQPVTISWHAEGAREVEVEGVGTGGATGSVTDYPERGRGYDLVASNTAGTARVRARPIAVLENQPFETQVLEVPAVDVPVDLPVTLLPNMDRVFAPELEHVIEVAPIDQQLVQFDRRTESGLATHEWQTLPAPPPMPELPVLALPEVPPFDDLFPDASAAAEAQRTIDDTDH